MEFDDKYSLNDSVESMCFENGGMLETFAPDINKVLGYANNKKTQRNVWTVVDGENDELIICAGYHFVNRIHYVITNEQWESEDEFYNWD